MHKNLGLWDCVDAQTDLKLHYMHTPTCTLFWISAHIDSNIFEHYLPAKTGQTQIRLHLKKQSDQGLSCLLFRPAFCDFQP